MVVCVYVCVCPLFCILVLLHTAINLLIDKLYVFEVWPENTMETYWLKDKE